MNRPSTIDFLDIDSLCQQADKYKSPQLENTRPVWIFGAGNFGRDVCKILHHKGFEIHGFIESNPKYETVSDLPVLTWDQLKNYHTNSQLVIGIFNRGTPLNELEALARSAGFTDIFMPWHLYNQIGQELGWRFWLSKSKTIVDNQSLLKETYESLADKESKQCLLDICSFRLGQHLAYGNFKHNEEQYFNNLTLNLSSNKRIRYIDGGAYNGDTFLDLANQVEVGSSYLFEPDPDNFHSLVETISEHSDKVMCLPLALSDHHEVLSFNAGNGEGGAISADGNVHIATVALDELLPNHNIDFIKLDVEGAEIQALKGGIELIKRSQPILAISLYHKPQDIWEIPLFVRKLLPNHKLYIRQHYYNSFDSVLYAVPVP